MNVNNSVMVQPEPLREKVVAAMRRAIVLGDLAPGTHLKEPLLAQRFGVSRLPVREALAQLEHEGLVRVEPRRGAFVVGVTMQDISDIFECRLMLEAHAVRHAAKRITPQEVVALQAIIDQYDAALASEQPQEMAETDMAFHRMLVLVSGNRALLSAWEPLAPLIETILAIANVTPGQPETSSAADDHHMLVRSLEQRDADAAGALLPKHMARGERKVLQAMTAYTEDANADR